MVSWAAFEGTRKDVIGDVNTNKVQSGVIVSNPSRRKRKSRNHLT